jgi:hypothetical protein
VNSSSYISTVSGSAIFIGLCVGDWVVIDPSLISSGDYSPITDGSSLPSFSPPSS